MSEVLAVVEGPAEQVFIRHVLAPWLGFQNVFMQATPIGGNKYSDAKRGIVNFLKQRSNTYVTCLFDFYGMGKSWPNREAANELNYEDRPVFVEAGILEDIQKEFDDSIADRFIPYIQMYEFEALLFCYPAGLSKALADSSSEECFQAIRDQFNHPELINDSQETAPSKRIIKVFSSYGRKYKKPFHGSVAAKATTIETMLDQCPRFSAWVNRLVETGAE